MTVAISCQLVALAADTTGVNGIALGVLIALFLVVTVAGFMATRFQRADSLASLDEIPGLGDMGYIALTAFVLNVVVSVVLSAVLNATKVSNGDDATVTSDYYADAGDPRVDHDLAEHALHEEGYTDPAR